MSHHNADLLSGRESEILVFLAKRFTRSKIADQLFISINTVKTHIRNIYQNLGLPIT
ncbi:MAG: helix-turn-helix transcriptional regulator [Chloroflexi bacterium]|nr:helix-turn-helix transcriptional regulator [Chloroflexota bacterium]